MQKVKHFVRTLRANYGSFAGKAVALFVLLIIGQAVMLAVPYFEGKIIDNLASREPFQTSLFFALAILAVYLTKNFLDYLRERYEMYRLEYQLSKYVNAQTLEKIFRFSLGQHVNENSGLRLSVVTKGNSALMQFMYNFIYSLLPFSVQIVLALLALSFLDPLLGGIVFLTSVVFIFSIFAYNNRFYPRLTENRDRWNKQSKHYSEILRNVKLVKLSAKEERTVSEYERYYESVVEPSRKMWMDYIGAYYGRNIVVYVGQVLALIVGVYLVSAGFDSPGKIVTLIGWMGSVFGNIGSLGWMQRQMLVQVGDINKYHEMLSREPAVKEAAEPKSLPKIGGRIEFRNVSFAYPKLDSTEEDAESELTKDEEASKEILTDVSFTIEPGETVAIVGRSGAGKTTVINLLLRGYDPDKGAVFIDGVDLREVAQKSYLRTIGYVPQFVELFDDTLRYNVTFDVPNPASVNETELDIVARKARIDQFYDRLGKKKFDTIIGENGIKLSGGERQRVGIARALLKQPEILIFDEATSNLDAENEAVIHEAMREALKGRTGIIIAHRLSTIRDADKIIVMDSGRVAGIGKHEELARTCEPYRKLVERQIVSL